MTSRFFAIRLGAAVAVLTMAPSLAFAYIDPGNGAYMVQALFTLVAAGMFYVRHPVRTFKMFVEWVSTKLTRSHSGAHSRANLDVPAAADLSEQNEQL